MKAPDKKTETKLERERDRAQTYLDGAGVMIVALDQAGNVALINKRGCEILGYAYDDIVGKNWFETFLPEYDRPRAYKAFCQIMAGDLEPVEYFENQVVTRTGEERFMAWHSNFV
ncbi:MAG: PAS domain S-box protein, partial [Deltaproteobacteria bacterium]|nr:PAS domain S-box protein [Deltaproteobacteria bacterium]